MKVSKLGKLKIMNFCLFFDFFLLILVNQLSPPFFQFCFVIQRGVLYALPLGLFRFSQF